MEKELPLIDLPVDWLIGTDINKDLLNMYANFPVRLNCEIYALCMSGTLDAKVNLNNIQVHPYDMVLLPKGCILQINKVYGEGEPRLYFLGFSSKFVEHPSKHPIIIGNIIQTLDTQILTLSSKWAVTVENYFKVLIDVCENLSENLRNEIGPNIYADIHKTIEMIYRRNKGNDLPIGSKKKNICTDFTQLVIKSYRQTRNVAWYAEQLGISHAHLCTIVKQATGNTCVDIISSMVIMDAKSQLKSTRATIQEIADSLNFADMSFFGKYFKRHVGMSPLEYRNSD